MEIKQVTIGKTTNLGNYENEYLEIVIDIAEGEKVSDIVAAARKVIAAQYAKKETNS